jgi:hypothetical protein
MNYGPNLREKQASGAVVRTLGRRLEAYVGPLLVELDRSTAMPPKPPRHSSSFDLARCKWRLLTLRRVLPP